MFEEAVGQGKVVGGDYVNGTVSTGMRGDVIVQAGLRRRKLVPDEVERWWEVTATGPTSSTAGALGKVVAGAVLPGLVGKVAGAALDATVGSAARPARVMHVCWGDGKESIIRMPTKLFTHAELKLKSRKQDQPGPGSSRAVDVGGAEPDAEKILGQIAQLSNLRDSGVLTDEEFLAKKTELLSRL